MISKASRDTFVTDIVSPDTLDEYFMHKLLMTVPFWHESDLYYGLPPPPPLGAAVRPPPPAGRGRRAAPAAPAPVPPPAAAPAALPARATRCPCCVRGCANIQTVLHFSTTGPPPLQEFGCYICAVHASRLLPQPQCDSIIRSRILKHPGRQPAAASSGSRARELVAEMQPHPVAVTDCVCRGCGLGFDLVSPSVRCCNSACERVMHLPCAGLRPPRAPENVCRVEDISSDDFRTPWALNNPHPACPIGVKDIIGPWHVIWNPESLWVCPVCRPRVFDDQRPLRLPVFTTNSSILPDARNLIRQAANAGIIKETPMATFQQWLRTDAWSLPFAGDRYAGIILKTLQNFRNLFDPTQLVMFDIRPLVTIAELEDRNTVGYEAWLAEQKDNMLERDVGPWERPSDWGPEWDETWEEKCACRRVVLNRVHLYHTNRRTDERAFVKPLAIIGPPGSGKTHTLRSVLAEALRSLNLNIAITAHAAERAKELGCWHLCHMFFINTHIRDPHERAKAAVDKIVRGYLNDKKKRDVAYWHRFLVELDVLFIDELGMVDASLLSTINIILQTLRGNKCAFGGVLVVAAGDPGQLEDPQHDPVWLGGLFEAQFETFVTQTFGRFHTVEFTRLVQEIYHGTQEGLDLLEAFIQNMPDSGGIMQKQKGLSVKEVYDRWQARLCTNPNADVVFLGATHGHTSEIMDELVPCLVSDGDRHLAVPLLFVEEAGGLQTICNNASLRQEYHRLDGSTLEHTVHLWEGARMFVTGTHGDLRNNEKLIVLDWEEPGDLLHSAEREMRVRVQREDLSDPFWMKQVETGRLAVPNSGGHPVSVFEKGFPLAYQKCRTVHIVQGRTYTPDTEVVFCLEGLGGRDPRQNNVPWDRRKKMYWEWAQVFVVISRVQRSEQLLILGNPDINHLKNFLFFQRPVWLTRVLAHITSPQVCVNPSGLDRLRDAILLSPQILERWRSAIPDVQHSIVVYLLRSYLMPQFFYVGSTSFLSLRLEQHNGTSSWIRGSQWTNVPHLQPWEVAGIVTGFPNTRVGRRLAYLFEKIVHRHMNNGGALTNKTVAISSIHQAFETWPEIDLAATRVLPTLPSDAPLDVTGIRWLPDAAVLERMTNNHVWTTFPEGPLLDSLEGMMQDRRLPEPPPLGIEEVERMLATDV